MDRVKKHYKIGFPRSSKTFLQSTHEMDVGYIGVQIGALAFVEPSYRKPTQNSNRNIHVLVHVLFYLILHFWAISPV